MGRGIREVKTLLLVEKVFLPHSVNDTSALLLLVHQASRKPASSDKNLEPRLPGFGGLDDEKDENARQRRRRPSSGTDLGLSQARRGAKLS